MMMYTSRFDRVVWCAGVPIRAVTREDAATLVADLARRRPAGGVDVHLCNAYTLALADQDVELFHVLRASCLNFPDGKSVTWANRLRDRGAPSDRVYGPNLFMDVIDAGREVGLSHFLLGSTPEVLELMVTRLKTRFPGVLLAGAYSPPFRPATDSEFASQVAMIRASGAHLVWIGLGTPKQDLQAARLAAEIPGVFVAVGAAFDFVAGTKRQAPAWIGDHGFEWLFRLMTEPRRLWKRYLLGNFRFLWAAITRRKHHEIKNGDCDS